MKQKIKEYVQTKLPGIIELRRALHKIPETGFNEVKTSSFIARTLEQAGFEVTTGIAKTGVTALLKGNGPGKTLLLRSDIDGLPIAEETGLPFASTHPGFMHACGHDGHIAILLGTALILKELKNQFSGQIKFVFQPAEEGPGGAKLMIEEGVLDNPKVDYALGLHLWASIPENKIALKAGPLMAAMDRFDLDIIGKGGHGAMPHLCKDPVDAAAQVINTLQRVVSRQMNPLSPTVVTIGTIQGGTAFNIIPDKVHLSGTTRTLDKEVWKGWESRLEPMINGVCTAAGVKYKLDYQPGYPPLINDSAVTEIARQAAAETVGSENVIEAEATMGGEDMAFYLEQVPGCYAFIGIGTPGCAPHHNSHFAFNEEVLGTGVKYLCNLVMEISNARNC
ncbi:amidohydrolase [Desulforhopalus vacuolatus]|uniref:M20 metallopeptidase family protein n=1 Tax=Desulforhopalus vacuolatus TaxID=40414 RepID=UPI0019666C1D|nr:M20 family metallopeptidase [Desulforhopalus vacuolatus]MBM9520573.1 amidohydrolase [Desulforhopalus vacuolatus]